MTNPFADISDPATLRAMVQDGVECQECHGARYVGGPVGFDCPTCNGTGHTPLPNADLDALAACWCEGEWVRKSSVLGHWYTMARKRVAAPVPAYTTSPVAAMRLMVKYNIGIRPFRLPQIDLGIAHTSDWLSCSTYKETTVESLCHAITTAALIAALTEGASDGN